MVWILAVPVVLANDSVEISQNTALILDPAAISLSPGQEFQLTMRIANSPDTNILVTDLSYDPTVLEYAGYTVGTDLADCLDPEAGLSEFAPGVITVYLDCFGSGVAGSREIATLRFRAAGPGEAGVDFANNLLWDSAGLDIPADWNGAVVAVDGLDRQYDLAATGLAFRSAHGWAGEQGTMELTVKNMGDPITDPAPLTDVYANFAYYYKYLGATPGLPGYALNRELPSPERPLGRGEELVYAWTGRFDASGDYVLEAIVDKGNALDETDEANNAISAVIRIGARRSAAVCEDTDGGADYYRAGTVAYGGTEVADGCAMKTGKAYGDTAACSGRGCYLKEAVCPSRAGGNDHRYYACPYGCGDGRCLPAPERTLLVTGKLVDQATGQPVAGASLRTNTGVSPSRVASLADGTFSFLVRHQDFLDQAARRKTADPVMAFDFSRDCYGRGSFTIHRDASSPAGLLIRVKRFGAPETVLPVETGALDLGELMMQPRADLLVYGDRPASFRAEISADGLSYAEFSDFNNGKAVRALSRHGYRQSLPLGHYVRLSFTAKDGVEFQAPPYLVPAGAQCQAVRLDHRNDGFVWDIKYDRAIDRMRKQAERFYGVQAADDQPWPGIERNEAAERSARSRYLGKLKAGAPAIGAAEEEAIVRFIAYGHDAQTARLGAGERAAVIASFKAAYGHLPATPDELSDALRIASGRWPAYPSERAEKRAKERFRLVYKRIADPDEARDSAAITIMAYGLRQDPATRNLESEQRASNSFRALFGRAPSSTDDWNTMQAIAYSGAARQPDRDGDLLPDGREAALGTDPGNPDTDRDGYPDGLEVENGYDPLGPGALTE